MPKRPCAIALTDDDDTLLCADKFGDVYALPLLAKDPPPPAQSGAVATPDPPPLQPVSDKEQLAEAKRRRTEISHDLPFAHKLLLGHVSMLTDILAVSRLPEGGGKAHKYILTADRDEHIRVSRYPQSYVIEGFCLGHKSFVSKLLIPSWDRSQLLSGGGDDFLLRWEWERNKIVETVPVAKLVEGEALVKVAAARDAEEKDGEFKPTLVGMWEIPNQKIVVVAFER
jgi:tRNA (guanine-N(7)-)-methyltransferase subunit TRM82